MRRARQRELRVLKSGQPTGTRCEYCSRAIIEGVQLEIEERVSWFRGDDEIYSVHNNCYNKKLQELKEKEERRSKMEKQIAENNAQKALTLFKLLKEQGISYKEYNGDGGHVCLGGVLDWWTSTGTARVRSTGQRYHLSLNDPQAIINIVKKYL